MMTVAAPFSSAISVVDRSIRNSADPVIAERRVAVHASGHALIGMLHHIEVARIVLQTDDDGAPVGRVEWTHREFKAGRAELPRQRRRRAAQQLLCAYMGGRGSELLDGFGWPGEAFTLDYAAPETVDILRLAQMMSPHDPGRIISGGLGFMSAYVTDPVISLAIKFLSELLLMERELVGPGLVGFVKYTLRRLTDEYPG